MRLPFADRLSHGWLAAWAAIALLCVLQRATDVLGPLDETWAEQGMAAATPAARGSIVLVDIDDASLAAVGPWPWPREVHARLIDRLTSAQAGLVVHTLPFVRPESQEALAQLKLIANAVANDPQLADHPRLGGLLQQTQDLLDGDARLALSITQNGRTVLAVAESAGGRIDWPMAQLSSAALGVGSQFWSAGPGGSIRTLPLHTRVDGRDLPSLPLWVAAAAIGRHPAELSVGPGQAAVLGAHRWPTDAHGEVRPAWQGARVHPVFDRVAAGRVLAGSVPAAYLAGRTVLIGTTSPTLEPPVEVAGAGLLSRLDVLAQASAALSGDRLVRQPGWTTAAQYGGAILAALLVTLSGGALAVSTLLALTAAVSALCLGVSYFMMSRWLIEVPVALPMASLWLGVALTAWITGIRRKSSGIDGSLLGIDPEDAASPVQAGAPTAPAALDTVPVPHAPIASAVSLASLPDVPSERAHARTVPAALGEKATETAGARAPSTAVPRRRLPVLGGFQLVREIGRGSMGRVYLAEHTGSGRMVAIKTLALAREFDGFALREARSRFQREALAALRLRHPDIVQVHDAGEDQGYAWIAMEWLQGHDLLRHTHAATLLPVPEVLEICARVAGALAHAHAQGVIHRDIKPANVMIEPRSGMVKVTDFGIARITDAARTRTGLVLGSPSYMSPEQLAGRPVDGRSDLYSMGVVLFQLLTGSLPAQGTSMAELMHAVAHVPAPDVRILRPRLPEAVANLVALALEKRVELRYAGAAALAADLHAVLSLWHPDERGSSFTPEGVTGSVQEVAREVARPALAAVDPEPVVHNGPL